MKVIIIDTNIIFRAILKPSNLVSEIIFNNGDQLEFYAPAFLRTEIDNHRDRIVALAKTNQSQINQVLF